MAHGEQRQRFIKRTIQLNSSVLLVVNHYPGHEAVAGLLEGGEVHPDILERTAMQEMNEIKLCLKTRRAHDSKAASASTWPAVETSCVAA
jgi:hypothetical protein